MRFQPPPAPDGPSPPPSAARLRGRTAPRSSAPALPPPPTRRSRPRRGPRMDREILEEIQIVGDGRVIPKVVEARIRQEAGPFDDRAAGRDSPVELLRRSSSRATFDREPSAQHRTDPEVRLGYAMFSDRMYRFRPLGRQPWATPAVPGSRGRRGAPMRAGPIASVRVLVIPDVVRGPLLE